MLAHHGRLAVFYIADGRRVASQNATRLIPDKKTRPMIADRLCLLHQQRTSQNRNQGTLELYTIQLKTPIKSAAFKTARGRAGFGRFLASFGKKAGIIFSFMENERFNKGPCTLLIFHFVPSGRTKLGTKSFIVTV